MRFTVSRTKDPDPLKGQTDSVLYRSPRSTRNPTIPNRNKSDLRRDHRREHGVRISPYTENILFVVVLLTVTNFNSNSEVKKLLEERKNETLGFRVQRKHPEPLIRVFSLKRRRSTLG